MKTLKKSMIVVLSLLLLAAPAFAGGGLDKPPKQPKQPEQLARKIVVAIINTDPAVEALLFNAFLRSDSFHPWEASMLPVPDRRRRGRAAAANVVNLYVSATLVSSEQKRSGIEARSPLTGSLGVAGMRTATEAVIYLRAILPSGQIIASVVGKGQVKGSSVNSQVFNTVIQRDRPGSFGDAMDISAMDATQKLINTLNQLQAQHSRQ